jgi:hypothetical protein
MMVGTSMYSFALSQKNTHMALHTMDFDNPASTFNFTRLGSSVSHLNLVALASFSTDHKSDRKLWIKTISSERGLSDFPLWMTFL